MTIPPLRKILCVEDEPLVQAIARAALEKRGGFTVLICGSGAEAIEAAPAGTPAALMTTKVQARELAPRGGLGIIGVIDKPFDPKTLAETLRALWARSHGEEIADGKR